MESMNITIVGGGVIGLATALALTKAGFTRIALIEKQAFPVLSEQKTRPLAARVSAITPASKALLQSIGVWDHLPEVRMGMMEHIRIWEEDKQYMHFDAASARTQALGYIIENEVLIAKLFALVKEQENINLYLQHEIETIEKTENFFLLHLKNQQTIKTDLLLGADGAKSWVREQANILTHVHDYRQIAIIAHLHTEFSHRNTAWQRFDKDQISAFLPLPDKQQVSLVWSVDHALAESLLALTGEDFAKQLSKQMHHCLGEVSLINTLQHFPLITNRASHYVQKHLVLLGDAARSLHPLAGQGVNLGLADVATLVQVLSDAKQEQRSIADLYILRRYERAVKARSQRLLSVLDGLFYGSRLENSLVTYARQLGFNSIAKCNPLKTWLMHQAMGV